MAGSQEKIDHSGHRARLKQRFIQSGLNGWSDYEVMELLLCYAIPRGDVNGLAHRLIDGFGSLSGVLDASPDELKRVPGMGEHSVTLLRLIPALGGRYLEERSDMGRIVRTADEAGAYLAPYFHGARNEMSYILCLDSKDKVLGVRKVSEGCIYAADINIRRIAEEALALRAARLYLAHNHISNLAFPSYADWQSTDTVRAALGAVGLDLVDHLIFVDGDMVSLNESECDRNRPVYQLL